MSFLFPAFLAALAVVAIPIIIHLFYFRRFKRVYFTNVRFLKELKEERSSRNRLKHLLVLLSRIIAIAALVLAFAQPYIPTSNSQTTQGTKGVSIYIDNSFSMNALSNDVSLFEKARYKAQEIIDAYSSDDRFQILTNDFEGRQQRLLNKDEAKAYIEELEISPTSRQLSQVFERQKQALKNANSQRNDVYQISDFQQNIVDYKNDTSYKVYLLPLEAVEQQNVYIDSVWFESPARILNQTNKLLVRIKNSGDKAVENSRITLNINGNQKSVKNFSVEAGKSLTDSLNFSVTNAGWQNCELLIEDYPITFDDSYYFAFEVAQQLNVLAINESSFSKYLNVLFNESRHFTFNNQNVTQIDYGNLTKNQLVILNGLGNIPSGLAAALQNYVSDGGNLLVFPNGYIDRDSYNTFLSSLNVNNYGEKFSERREVGQVNTQSAVFNDVFEKISTNMDLPFASGGYDMTSYSQADEEPLLSFRGGRALMSSYSSGNGRVYICASPLDTKYSNLPAHALFVPMVYKIAVLGSNKHQIAYTIGKSEVVELDNKTDKKDVAFKLKGKKEEFIPTQRNVANKLILNLDQQIKIADNYQLYMEENKPLYSLGFNYDRQESDLSFYTNTQLREQYVGYPNVKFLENRSNLPEIVGKFNRGVELWKWCLLVALGALLVETLLLRFWKN